MELINVRYTTGTAIARGLRDECYGTMMDIRPIDAPEFIPTGSHIGRPVNYDDRLYLISAEDWRGIRY